MSPIEKKPDPIYIVRLTLPAKGIGDAPQVVERFVRAPTKAAAQAHVIESAVHTELAQADDLIRLGAMSIPLETVTPKAAPTPTAVEPIASKHTSSHK